MTPRFCCYSVSVHRTSKLYTSFHRETKEIKCDSNPEVLNILADIRFKTECGSAFSANIQAFSLAVFLIQGRGYGFHCLSVKVAGRQIENGNPRPF